MHFDFTGLSATDTKTALAIILKAMLHFQMGILRVESTPYVTKYDSALEPAILDFLPGAVETLWLNLFAGFGRSSPAPATLFFEMVALATRFSARDADLWLAPDWQETFMNTTEDPPPILLTDSCHT